MNSPLGALTEILLPVTNSETPNTNGGIEHERTNY